MVLNVSGLVLIPMVLVGLALVFFSEPYSQAWSQLKLSERGDTFAGIFAGFAFFLLALQSYFARKEHSANMESSAVQAFLSRLPHWEQQFRTQASMIRDEGDPDYVREKGLIGTEADIHKAYLLLKLLMTAERKNAEGKRGEIYEFELVENVDGDDRTETKSITRSDFRNALDRVAAYDSAFSTLKGMANKFHCEQEFKRIKLYTPQGELASMCRRFLGRCAAIDESGYNFSYNSFSNAWELTKKGTPSTS